MKEWGSRYNFSNWEECITRDPKYKKKRYFNKKKTRGRREVAVNAVDRVIVLPRNVLYTIHGIRNAVLTCP